MQTDLINFKVKWTLHQKNMKMQINLNNRSLLVQNHRAIIIKRFKMTCWANSVLTATLNKYWEGLMEYKIIHLKIESKKHFKFPIWNNKVKKTSLQPKKYLSLLKGADQENI